MANVIDYVKWRGDLTLKKSKYNEIDSLILNRFSYFPFDNIMKKGETISIKELGKRFEKKDEKDMEILWKYDVDLFPVMSKSKRFGDMLATEYVNKIEDDNQKQFSAITVFLPDDTIYVSFRGTDLTIIGWKEDFNMSFEKHIPSEISAKEYLEYIAEKYPNKKIRTGGHSKGGTLAMYASIFSKPEVRERIINIYNNDGPGFHEEITNLEEYKEMLPKMITYIPQDSVIGMLLNHKEKCVVVKSTEKGILQHDIYSWQIVGTEFEVLKEVTNSSKFVDKTITSWLENMDMDTRKQIIDMIFDLIGSTNAKKFSDLKLSWLNNTKIIFSSYNQIDTKNKKKLIDAMSTLFGVARDNIIEGYKENQEKKEGEE